jgi:hypothetical protein
VILVTGLLKMQLVILTGSAAPAPALCLPLATGTLFFLSKASGIIFLFSLPFERKI